MSLNLTKMKLITEVNLEKLTFATFMERSAFTVNTKLDQTFAPLKGQSHELRMRNFVPLGALTQ